MKISNPQTVIFISTAEEDNFGSDPMIFSGYALQFGELNIGLDLNTGWELLTSADFPHYRV